MHLLMSRLRLLQMPLAAEVQRHSRISKTSSVAVYRRPLRHFFWGPNHLWIPTWQDQTVTDVQNQLVTQGGLWLIDRGLADPKIFEMTECGDPFNNKKIYPIHATCHSECVKLKLHGTYSNKLITDWSITPGFDCFVLTDGSVLGLVARGCRDEIQENSRSQVYDAVKNHSNCFGFQLTSKHSKISLDGTVCLCLGNLCNPASKCLSSMLYFRIALLLMWALYRN